MNKKNQHNKYVHFSVQSNDLLEKNKNLKNIKYPKTAEQNWKIHTMTRYTVNTILVKNRHTNL